jgi:hypothetical protein
MTIRDELCYAISQGESGTPSLSARDLGAIEHPRMFETDEFV